MEITEKELKLISQFIKAVKDGTPPPFLTKELAIKLKNLMSH